MASNLCETGKMAASQGPRGAPVEYLFSVEPQKGTNGY